MALDVFNPYLFVSAGEQSNKYLTPSYAGGIASFQAQRAQALAKLLLQIDAVQEGTGDPSPTNVRPITGWTGFTITQAGKNLMPNMAGEADSTNNGITYVYNDDGSINITGTATAASYSKSVAGLNYLIYLPKGTYKKPQRIYVDETHAYGLLVQYVTEGTWTTVEGGSAASDTFVIDQDYPIVVRAIVTNGAVLDNVRFEPYIYPESISEPAWIPPVKEEYDISWQTEAGTVYGGTLDAVSGVLTVTHGYIEYDGTENWSAANVGTTSQRFYIAKPSDASTAVSADGYTTNMFVPAASGNSGSWGTITVGGTDFKVRDGAEPRQFESLDDFKTWLGTNNLQIVYPLDEPVEYQLDPGDIMTLPGYNQIYTDAGPVLDVEF